MSTRDPQDRGIYPSSGCVSFGPMGMKLITFTALAFLQLTAIRRMVRIPGASADFRNKKRLPAYSPSAAAA